MLSITSRCVRSLNGWRSFWPCVVNLAMVLGLAPVVGIALPLFSYGGSALITSMIGIGILMNVSMRRYVF